MSLTIAVTNLKGGAGKSTLSVNLAACLHHAGHQVLIVDSDSQGTCRNWASRAADDGHEGPPVVGMDSKALRRDLPTISKGYDVVIIDTPPRMGIEARAAMLAAHVVVLPVIPGGADVWALKETLDVLEDAQALRPDLRAVVVPNRVDRTTLATLTRAALDDTGVRVLDETLGSRVAYGEATLAGRGVVDYAPSSTAAKEVKAVTAAILSAVDGGCHGAQA